MLSNLNKLIFFLIIPLFVVSCKKNDGYNQVVDKNATKPDVVTNVKVDNFNGGAFITYDLPASGNVLYVLAEYKINDTKSRQTKSSYYSDTVLVDGFAKSQEYEVTLHTVSRANVMSDAVVVKVHPDTPAYLLAKPTIVLTPDFGGVKISVQNPLNKALGVIFLAYDTTTNSMEIQDQHYSDIDSFNYSVRGYAVAPRKFGAYVIDQYGNISDTVTATLIPLFEELFDKGKFFTYNLPTDSPIGYGWELNNLWNGNIDGTGWHTNPGDVQPMVATFGLGATGKISRFVIWERTGTFTYGHGNPKVFAVWGSDKSSPADVKLPITAPVGTVLGDWVNLGNFKYPDPPSGLAPGATNGSDEAFVKAGVSFDNPSSTTNVKFLRISVSETWGQGNFAHIMELSVYGEVQ